MGKNEVVGESPPGEERYRANPDFVLRKVAGEAILLPTGETAQKLNGMITLSETALFLWKKLTDSSQTIKDLSDALVKEYRVSTNEVTSDVESFIQNAYQENLIQKA